MTACYCIGGNPCPCQARRTEPPELSAVLAKLDWFLTQQQPLGADIEAILDARALEIYDEATLK
jgi:hypothetical protein